MDLFKDILEGVARGFVSGVSEMSSFISASDAVETCCGQLGWTIDERLDANKVCLHFKDPLLGIRKVIVSAGCQETMVGFAVISAVALPAEQVPASVLGYLLDATANCPLRGRCSSKRTAILVSPSIIALSLRASNRISSRCSVERWSARPRSSTPRCIRPDCFDSESQRIAEVLLYPLPLPRRVVP